jgi:hypothetical protein
METGEKADAQIKADLLDYQLENKDNRDSLRRSMGGAMSTRQ